MGKIFFFPVYEVKTCAEGKGLFATVDISKGQFVTEYGGVLHNKNPEPQDWTRDYNLEFSAPLQHEGTTYRVSKWLVPDTSSTLTDGQLLNHSKKHFNLVQEVVDMHSPNTKVLFKACKDVKAGTQLVYNYGGQFQGVEDCVRDCSQCGR